MSRAFSAKEIEAIRKTLIEKGKELFASHGLKKTGIAELAKAAGIAQGSFYKFFGSKEELLFAIMEEEEKRIHEILTAKVARNLTRAKLKDLLVNGMAIAESNPVIRLMMDPEVYQQVVRKLPEEKIHEHIDRDNAGLIQLIRQWQEEGRIGPVNPAVLTGMLRAVFTISLHKQEIGEVIFPEVVDLLAETIARGLIREEQQDD